MSGFLLTEKASTCILTVAHIIQTCHSLYKVRSRTTSPSHKNSMSFIAKWVSTIVSRQLRSGRVMFMALLLHSQEAPSNYVKYVRRMTKTLELSRAGICSARHV